MLEDDTFSTASTLSVEDIGYECQVGLTTVLQPRKMKLRVIVQSVQREGTGLLSIESHVIAISIYVSARGSWAEASGRIAPPAG
jgi:hypothetical protein